ncbi:MAG: yqfC [Bacilli bacterium]|nr:yqfC [Bacilli bacterium]
MAGTWTNRIKLATASLLEVPKDTLIDLPRVTLVGGLQLLVENHKGIVSFDDQVLTLALTQGHLVIRGHALVVKSIFEKEINIEGTIEHVEYRH